jgi:hypothetical protein
VNDRGTLILGADTPILDLDVRSKHAVVTIGKTSALGKKMPGGSEKTITISVPFDAISWIAPGLEL